MIRLSLLNKKDLHEDLKIQIGCMDKETLADSYYFFIGLTEDDKPRFRTLFKDHFNSISLKIEQLQPNEQLNIPIALYDEYTDFICVRNFNSRGVCNLYLCSAYIEGWKINPWGNDNYNLDKNLVFGYRGGVNCNIQDVVKGLKESLSAFSE